MATMRTGKTLTLNLGEALRWCGSKLAAGMQVWCVRRRDTGGVVTYICGSVENVGLWLSFDGEPLDNFSLTPMEQDAEAGARFGRERDWKGGLQQ